MTRQKQILVVEDEEHLAIGIKYNLEEEGYRVETANDGPTALRFVADHAGDVDLVILDLMLPGMSGYAVCESLREAGENMPVLILSARTLTEDRTRGFDVGADQYLNKPFELDELLSRVNNLMTLYSRRSNGGGEKLRTRVNTFEFGNARVNFGTFEVVVGGKPVRLTQMQMKLLQYFVENEGRVIPRAELLKNVWGLPGHLNTRAPDQFMRKLRKMFEPEPARPCHFLTVRDAGYRFSAVGDASAQP
jgi:two-component system OmpR family response regulator